MRRAACKTDTQDGAGELATSLAPTTITIFRQLDQYYIDFTSQTEHTNRKQPVTANRKEFT